jgi:histo-blood group ABO system transferase
VKTALLIIATGPAYWGYARNLIQSAEKFLFPHDVILFTDNPTVTQGAAQEFYVSTMTYPDATYLRYHVFCDHLKFLDQYDYLFYSDADMLFVAPVTPDEILSAGITATEHPGYVGQQGNPETRKESTAYCPQVRQYFCGGFNGGTKQAFLNMAVNIKWDITQDQKNGIQAVWFDESHTNRYLYDNPPTKVLSPSFCYPESEYKNPSGYYRDIWNRAKRGPFEPKLLALDKGGK